MLNRCLLFFAVFCACATDLARADPVPPSHPERFCESFLQAVPDFAEAGEHFDADFLRAISVAELIVIFRDLYAETGACSSWNSREMPSGNFEFHLGTASGLDVQLNVHFNATTGKCDGLVIAAVDDPTVVIRSWDDVNQASMRFMSGPSAAVGAYFGTTDGAAHLDTQADQTFAIGSTFKLYVLGALQNSISVHAHDWSESLAIHNEWKSLPSGQMQDFDAGELHPLSEYAFRMIAASDNTATDHLIHLLGREGIEAQLSVMGMNNPVRNSPLMTTQEMFKLKWAVAPTESQAYIVADPSHRRVQLLTLGSIPLSQVGHNGVSMDKPTLVREIEWFASPRENCSAMLWLAQNGSAEVRSSLEYRVPFVDRGRPESHWSYAGYKGGSEPGVLSVTYLLETAAGSRACFSMSWNDPDHELRRLRFFDIVKKTIRFAESVVHSAIFGMRPALETLRNCHVRGLTLPSLRG